MLNYFHKQFAYNNWANSEALASFDRMPVAPLKAVSFFAHILSAERLWWTRLQKQSTEGFPVWPNWTIDQCAQELVPTAEIWHQYLSGLQTEMLLHTISYKNTKGEEWRNTVLDILTHVIIHSGYHRGQIAAEIRKSGGEPAYTDYIHAVRQGFIAGQIPDAGQH